MQYADVALAVKTANRQESYTYRIPPALLADIKVGQRVSVPFYRRELIGTIVDLRAVPPKIRATLKEIKGLVEPFPLFDGISLQLAREVAQKYGATIGQVLEVAAPKPAKRAAKRLELISTSSRYRPEQVSKVYGLYKPVAQRVDDYIQLINNALKNKKAALVLFPTQEFCHDFSQILTEQGIGNLVMPPTGELTDHYSSWIQARVGEISVLIGTRKTIFVPLANLRLIIVDSPSLYGYKEEQFPYYHTLSVAKIKARLTHSHLIIGDAAPRLEEWDEGNRQKLSYLPPSEEKTIITLVDTTSHRGLISEVLLDHIRDTLAKKGRAALFYNRKGSGRFYRCLECETATYCPRCDNLLTVFEKEKTILRCSDCGYETSPPYRCEVCQSYRLGSVGLGIESLAKIMAKHFPDSQIATLESNIGSPQAHDILITTAQLYYLPLREQYDLLASFHIDQSLHGSQWDTNEAAFLTLSHLAERTRHLVIHSSEPEHPAIQAIRTGNYDSFYMAELEERKKGHYPPAATLLRLTISGADREQLKQQAEELYQKYRRLLSNPEHTLFPPSPIRSGKRRGKYRYQIIIKAALTNKILDNLPSDWQLDTEPIEI